MIKSKIINIFYYLFLIIILCFGLFLRIKQYIGAYPMWEDEINCHINIIKYPFLHCFHLLDNYQMAPPLFQAASKFITNIFGYDIFVIRIIPFLSGIFSLILFIPLLNKTFTGRIPALFAFFFFAVSAPVVYYSSEFKPYESDILVTIVLILLYDKINFQTKKSYIFWLVLFFLFPFFSFTSLIVLGAVIIMKNLDVLFSKKLDLIQKKNELLKLLLFPILLLISAFLIYQINSVWAPHFKRDYLIGYISFVNPEQLFTEFTYKIKFFFNYLNLMDKPVHIFFFCGLIFSFFNKNKYVRLSLIIFLLQIFASIIQAYPIFERVALFSVPVWFIIMSSVLDIEDNKLSNKFSIAKSIVLLVLFFSYTSIHYCLNNVMQKDYSLSNQSVEIRRLKKDETINFLNVYKSGEKFITKNDFKMLADYYNLIYKYNFNLNYVKSFYPCENEISAVEAELNNNKNENYWIFGVVNSIESDTHIIKTNEDLEDLIKKTKRKYVVYPTKNGNIYYLLRE